ncbi:hypothetical protein ACMGE5_06480 [Macrococcus equi]|uniref:hypothetical protein n=1 Tax=Macrococcus equi TaxID=3395462 RepID=UPI0039BDF25D
MNKFSQKMLEISKENSSVIELQSQKVSSELQSWIDVIFNFAFSLKNAFSQLKNLKYNYLESVNNCHTLITIDRDMNIEKQDVTEIINKSPNKQKFIYNNIEYKIFKVLK